MQNKITALLSLHKDLFGFIKHPVLVVVIVFRLVKQLLAVCLFFFFLQQYDG